MATLKIISGDFIEHSGSTYFMGAFTLWGWKQGETKPSQVQLTVGRDVADLKLKSADPMPVGAMGAGGALRGAVLGAMLGGSAGAVAGAITGAASSAASAKVYNGLTRKGRQRFSVTFADGRRLEAEMDIRIVAGMQNRLIRKRRTASLRS